MWEIIPVPRTWLDESAGRTCYAVRNRASGNSLGTFASEERARYWALVGFRRDFAEDPKPLRVHDLVCWCPLTYPDGTIVPCHADVLLELANGEAGRLREPDGEAV